MILKIFILLLIHTLSILANPLKNSGSSDKAKDFLVTELPGLYQNVPKDDIPTMFAGQLELFLENNTNYFFWKFSDREKIPEAKKRTIFWLNGGPGCSSMDGALMESGPFRIDRHGEVTLLDGSWHKAGDMVFVDQPAGTGFSFTDVFRHDLDQISLDFLRFLDKYFELFPEDRQNEIFFAGESYAGQYIPYIADGILKYNKAHNDKPYNIKGLLIGNGWISPNEQSLSYLPYSVQAGIIKTDNPMWSSILSQHQKCQKIVDEIDSLTDNQVHMVEVDSSVCEEILNMILSATRDRDHRSQECFNMYDYTLKDTFPSCGMNWPPDLNHVNPFLNNEQVQNDLNLKKSKQWKECSGKVGHYFNAHHSLPSIHLFPNLLKELNVMLFHGNRDIICNYMGAESMIKKLTWNGETGFGEESEKQTIDWIHHGKNSGYIKTARNLTFVNVFDSSHMVPFDIPETSRALIDLITGNYDVVDEKSQDDLVKRSFVTYPLGERQAKLQSKPEDKPATTSTSVVSSTPSSTTSTTPISSSSNSSVASDQADQTKESHTTSRVTRLIQLLVIVVLIWGMCVMYNSYRSRPSSIIKTRPSSGRKKNVQWADQLRQFQEEDDFPLHDNENRGFLSKAFSKFKGNSKDGRGSYAPAGTSEDIELGENMSRKDEDAASEGREVDDFIIESEDEDDRHISLSQDRST